MPLIEMSVVRAGQYEGEIDLAAFDEKADAEEFARRYNAERGHGLEDADRARVESLTRYTAGDHGRSGHVTTTKPHPGAWGHPWLWTCTCRAGTGAPSEQDAADLAARHVEHWTSPAA